MRRILVYKVRGSYTYTHSWLCALPDGRMIYTTTWQDAMKVARQEVAE